MISITVKTIDSNNYDFSVEENISVKDFKDLIAPKVNVSPDLQRLIFCGRVLTDDKLLKDYEINDGKVVHLVVRAPPGSGPPRPGSAPASSQSSPRHNHNGRRRPLGRTNDENSYLLGAFSIPHEAFNPNSFQQMLQNVVSNMGDIGRNATVMSRTSEDGSVDVQINLAQLPPQNETRQRLAQANRFIGYVNAIIDVIERPDNIPQMNGSFTVDANNIGSLEAQLAAQAAAQSVAAASNHFGLPLVIEGTAQTRDQTPPNPTIRVTQPIVITSESTGANGNSEARAQTHSQTNNNSNNGQNGSRPVVAAEVNELLNSVFASQERFRPHIQRYQELMSIEGQLTEQQSAEAQSLQRNIMRANHHLAHVFHLISDLTINFSSQNRTVGVIQSLTTQTSMESVSVSVPFASRQTSSESTARSDTQSTATAFTNLNSNPPTSQSASDVAATAGSTTHTTHSVPRFSQSRTGDQSSSVFVAQSPIVVMEVGSTVERIPIPIPTSNAPRSESNQPNSTTPTFNSSRPLFIPPFDPFLQCTSPFTIPEIRTRVSVGISAGRNSRQPHRTAGNNNNNNTNNNNNNSENNNDMNSQSANIPFASLGQIVNGILSGFLGQANAPEPNQNTNNNSNATTGEPSVNVDPTLIDLMGRLNNERPSVSESSADDGSVGSDGSYMTDMFMSFVNGILQIISGGQTNAINVAHFLNQMEGFSYVEGENVANDVFMVMARVLSFQDLFLIFAGNPEPLNRVRDPLRQFVQTSILNGNEANGENIESAITSIINSWKPGLQVMITGLSLLPGINLMATIEHFLRFNLNRIFSYFLFPPEPDYGNTFFAIIREILIDLISLSQVCFTDGVLALQRMVGALIENVSSDMNPSIQEWMRSVANRHLNEYINNNNTEQSPNTQTYVVRTQTISESSDPTVGANERVNDTNEERLEAESVEFSDALSDLDEPINTSSNNSSNQMETSYNEIPAVVIGSESWHSSVPTDWVPIITNDLERQRRLPIQRPFSDAYLNGMAKKRKLEKRPLNLRDSLRSALSSSGVRPIVSTTSEEILNEIAVNSGLNESFDDLVRCAVTERIVNDDDFINARTQTPERFPNSKNYFKSE